MNNKVSVIIPVYKVEPYLNKCVDSVINQTYRNVEIILVDDGSPDRCGEICDEYASKDNRIKVIHKQNGGLSDARNEGLKIATGEYISLLDSDDYWKPKYLEDSVSFLQDNNVDLVVFPLCSVNEKGEIIKELDSRKMKVLTPEEALCMMFSSSLPWCAQGKLYKKHLFDGITYPVGMLMEDKATTYKIFEKCNRILFVECSDYMYLIREGSIMHSKFDQRQLHTLKIQEELNAHLCESFPQLQDVVLGYSSRVYLAMICNMIAVSYSDRKAIETTIDGWYRNCRLLSKSKVVDIRYKILSTISCFYYFFYGKKMYRSITYKLICKKVSQILQSK